MSLHQLPRVLVTRAIAPEAVDRLRQAAEVEYNAADTPWSPEELSSRLVGKVGVVCSASCPMSAEVLRRAPTLRAVSNVAVGHDNFDTHYMRAHGIVGMNTPDILTETTADFGWSLLMAAARRVTEADAWLRSGAWRGWAFDQFLGSDLHGSTLGIVGFGRIGQALARRACGFGMRLLVNTKRHEVQMPGVTAVSLEQLLRESDHVLLALPLLPETWHLIGAAQLALMKPGATLVNLSRGGIVDDAALSAALQRGTPGAAALDVHENEPRVHPALLACRRAVLTPHIASASHKTRLRMAHLAVDNLLAALAGRPINRVV